MFGSSARRREEEAAIRGYVYLVSAIDKHMNQQPGAQQHAASALALAEGMKPASRIRQQVEAYGSAILEGDLQGLIRPVLLDLIEEPEAHRLLEDLNRDWPEQIDGETSELLHRWIGELVALQDRRRRRSKKGL